MKEKKSNNGFLVKHFDITCYLKLLGINTWINTVDPKLKRNKAFLCDTEWCTRVLYFYTVTDALIDLS